MPKKSSTQATKLKYKRKTPVYRFWKERFVVLEDFCYQIPDELQHLVKSPFSSTYLQIVRENGKWVMWIRKGYEWDGASLVLTTDSIVLASLLHDVIYDFVWALAVAWGTNRVHVRHFGDELFRIKLARQRSWARRIYPYVVERVGGLWNEIGLLFRNKKKGA